MVFRFVQSCLSESVGWWRVDKDTGEFFMKIGESTMCKKLMHLTFFVLVMGLVLSSAVEAADPDLVG